MHLHFCSLYKIHPNRVTLFETYFSLFRVRVASGTALRKKKERENIKKSGNQNLKINRNKYKCLKTEFPMNVPKLIYPL